MQCFKKMYVCASVWTWRWPVLFCHLYNRQTFLGAIIRTDWCFCSLLEKKNCEHSIGVGFVKVLSQSKIPVTVIRVNSEVRGAGMGNSASERTGEGCWTWQNWRLDFVTHSGKCLSVNPKYSLWISITMMMQACRCTLVDMCVREEKVGFCETCIEVQIWDFWMWIWTFLGLAHPT